MIPKNSKLIEELKVFLSATLVTSIVFGGSAAYYAFAATDTETLTVTIATSLTFTTTTSAYDEFGTLTPGTPKFATTTLSVTTNNVPGYLVTLYGNDQGSANTVMDLTTDASIGIADQLEWWAGAATTSVGNAVRIGSLDSSQKVLAFRVMTASGSQPFRSTTWWGTADNYTDNASTLWAGIGSSTVAQQIGNAGVGSYSASAQ